MAGVDLDCVLLAGRYSLLERGGRRALLDGCAERGVGVILGGVFNSGVLADPHRSDVTYEYAPAAPAFVERAQQIEAVCRRFDVALGAGRAAVRDARIPPSPRCSSARAPPRRSPRTPRSRTARSRPGLWGALVAEGLLDRSAPLPGVG